jgi:hypothetical protein
MSDGSGSQNAWLRGMSPAFRLMLATSWLAPESWQKRQEQDIRLAHAAGPDWDEYLRLVDRHRTPALSWAALKRVPGLEIPENVSKVLKEGSDACRLTALRHIRLLSEVLKAFNENDIPVMPLKGPFLSLDLYGDLGLRQSKDIDLEIALEDIPRAQTCLYNLGYVLEPEYFPMTPRQKERFQLIEHHLGFTHFRDGCHLELCWRDTTELPEQTSARWNRKVPAIWQRSSYWQMDAIGRVLFLCCHAGGHAWFRAKWLGDVARIRANEEIDWEAALDEARKMHQERILLAAMHLLQQAYGLPLPALPEKAWKNLPMFLVNEPLRALANEREHEEQRALPRLRNGFRSFLYLKRLLPLRTWRQTLLRLTYYREDFREFPLPDSFFWAYAPLRPVFWIWRRLRPRRIH